MAAISPATVAELPPEIPQWLKNLPLAPEYHPTLEEFQDPISYILKIEKEASKYGICKIIPPVPSPPKKTAITNLNRSLAARNPNHNPKSQPTFTTRHQQIGFCPRKPRPVQRPVWQSGESYTVQQFEAKAKHFEKTHLKKGGKKGFSPLEIETLFWKASVDKPFTVEYANDMPGSAFVPINEKKWREAGEAATVGETAWNMRGVSRAKGSLLRFMKEEIPGVTSPMVYLAMMFSWFAWHVEDHDLHSLNYMHLGAGKTWYGVPREAAVAFEEVIRVHGYGGEVNPLVTFATLGEKTTVMSPEVLIVAGIPCCRLVQNVGEFVVTFPRAYHSGFSHGFNCGEAANIATPEWLTVAKEAAIRRASINYPPMVSHFQLLYALALTLCSRVPMSIDAEPRSSRLKDKKRGEGQTMVKELFIQNMIQNNDLLHILLEQGTSCVLLPQNSSEMSLCSNLRVKPRLSLGLGSNEDGASKGLHSNDIMPDRNESFRHLSGFSLVRRKSSYGFERDSLGPSSARNANCGLGLRPSTSMTPDVDTERGSTSQGAGSLDQGLFSCVTCGILNFACAIVIQPKEEAAQYFMSSDCSFFNDWTAGSGTTNDRFTVANGKDSASNINYCSGGKENTDPDDGLYDVPIQSGEYEIQVADEIVEVVSDTGKDKVVSSLDLLAFAYGNSSDSEEEERVEPDTMLVSVDEGGMGDCSPLSNEKNDFLSDNSGLHSHEAQLQVGTTDSISQPSSRIKCGNEDSIRTYQRNRTSRRKQNWSYNIKGKGQEIVDCSIESDSERLVNMESNGFQGSCRNSMVASGRMVAGSAEVNQSDMKMDRVESRPTDYLGSSNSSHILLNCPVDEVFPETIKSSNIVPLVRKSDEESSRRHIFCLEHAIEVEKQLRSIGGVDMLLLCHPEYPRVESEAKSLAEELRENYVWKDIPFREASITDREIIRAALEDEEAIPSNGDWAVKLGINLYYSVSLSQSPLYSKQMPYNEVIYKAFGRSSPGNSPTKPKASGRGFNKQKKIVVAGKWCGKVWMSNQVHPFLVQRDIQEERPVRFHARTMTDLKLEGKPNMQIEEPPQSSLSDITTIIRRKVAQKRKRTLGQGTTTKRLKSSKVESPVEDAEEFPEDVNSPPPEAADNSPPEDDNSPPPPPRGGRILRSCLTKHGSPPPRKSSARSIRRTYDDDSGSKDETDQGGPSTRLRRRRASKPAEEEVIKEKPVLRRASKPAEEVIIKEKTVRDKKTTKNNRTSKKGPGNSSNSGNEELALKDAEAEYQCDMEGCSMGFNTKQELIVHKRNICSVKGCGKKFFSHKYLIQHRRVHMDDRPLKCPWRGCKMSFKWAWARTEHIRVHTGARPYVCREPGCGQTFRFVSDFSRHKRKTGHAVKGKG